MSDEALTRIYQRLGRVEDKLDEVLELLRPAHGTRVDDDTANWQCDSCNTTNTYNRGNCVGCGTMRPRFG